MNPERSIKEKHGRHFLWLVSLLVGIGLLAGRLLDARAENRLGEPTAFAGRVQEQPAQRIGPGEITLSVELQLPPGWQLTPETPATVRVAARDPHILALGPGGTEACRQPRFPLHLPLVAQPGQTVLEVDLLLSFCRTDGKGLCLLREVRLTTPITVDPASLTRNLSATYRLSLP